MATEGTVGTNEKGDCLVTVNPGNVVDVATKSPEMLEPGIRAVIEETLHRIQANDVGVSVSDEGALDHVIAARVEAAVRATLPDGGKPLVLNVQRVTSGRHRPRRSRLYAPGNQPRLLVGIDLHGADCVLLDLEDSVPLSEKRAARILVKHTLFAVPFQEEVWVRINPLDAGGREDVAEILIGQPNGICLPKAESANDVQALSELLAEIESECGIGEGTTWIMPIIETARGILHAEAIASADPRIVLLAFGAEDYTRDVGALRSRHALLFARSMLVAAARAAGVQASDTIYANVEDEPGLAEECVSARELGFDGKGAINPRQLPTIHQAFSPTEAELEHARAIVEAAREAEVRGLGAVSLDGRMIDRPVLDRATRLIKYADRLSGGDRHA